MVLTWMKSDVNEKTSLVPDSTQENTLLTSKSEEHNS